MALSVQELATQLLASGLVSKTELAAVQRHVLSKTGKPMVEELATQLGMPAVGKLLERVVDADNGRQCIKQRRSRSCRGQGGGF